MWGTTWVVVVVVLTCLVVGAGVGLVVGLGPQASTCFRPLSGTMAGVMLIELTEPDALVGSGVIGHRAPLSLAMYLAMPVGFGCNGMPFQGPF